jgi:type III secretion system YscD/HrpQ family protein
VNGHVRILSGLHSGARTSCADGERYLIGSDPSCSIVLMDDGVSPRHCLIAIDPFGITCRAVDATVFIDGREIAAGETASVKDLQVIRCGPVVLSIGPVEADWSNVERAAESRHASARNPVRSLRRMNPYALFASVLLGMTTVLGLAYAALADRPAELTPMRIGAARAWLEAVAPKGSDLQIGADDLHAGHFLMSGYVSSSDELASLSATSKESLFRPRVAVYAADELVSSVQRLAQLAGIACAPQYKGAGRVACGNTVANDATATRLQTIARDVPGLRGLEVHTTPPLVSRPARAPSTTAAATPQAPAAITEKFAVLMNSRGRFFVGRYGERYAEGDQFDGFTLRRIGLDVVIFERDGKAYEFRVATLGDRVGERR